MKKRFWVKCGRCCGTGKVPGTRRSGEHYLRQCNPCCGTGRVIRTRVKDPKDIICEYKGGA